MNKMGRPKMEGTTELIQAKMKSPLLGAFKQYCQDTGLSRSAALRSLVQYGINYYYFIKTIEGMNDEGGSNA